MSDHVVILGIFVADLAFRAGRLPLIGETIEGAGFKMGPGGKGSNQAVAAARAGGAVTIITRLGADEFGRLARDTWAASGVNAAVTESATSTGAAFIYVHTVTGDNAIIVVPGAASEISVADIEASADIIGSAGVFLAQLEQPLAAARRGLEIARAAGVTTILNPAPAQPLDEAIYTLCDYVTPNETEAAALTGTAVSTVDDARRAGDLLLGKGVGTALITLGASGSLLHTASSSIHVPPYDAGAALETTGAGDAFNGAFAAALTSGRSALDAAHFASAAAGISVTRPGTAPSMPRLDEIKALLEGRRA
jgi:ribokinase